MAALSSALETSAAARDEHQVHAVERIVDPCREPLRLLGRGVADVAHDDDARRGHERRALQRGRQRRERGQLRGSFRRTRVVVVLGGFGVARAAPARERVVVERERTVLAREQLVDETLHLAVAEHRIGTLDQVDAHSIASIVRHTRAVPADVVHPHDPAAVHDAVRDRRE